MHTSGAGAHTTPSRVCCVSLNPPPSHLLAEPPKARAPKNVGTALVANITVLSNHNKHPDSDIK